ncbi:MAG: hypothetical protein PHI71_01545 [Acidiphilium sp.]|nr:hypothetical protein [Acidiphilium sp.]
MAALAFITHVESAASVANIQTGVSVQEQTAQSGAEVFNACLAETASGVYTVPELVTAGYLPAGFPANTALGNQWVCEVVTGSVSGSIATLVLWDAAPSQQGDYGVGSFSDTNLQTGVAWGTASVLQQQLSADSSAIVGVVRPGTTVAISPQSRQQTDLSGLIQPPAYSTPIIEQGD